MLFILSASIYTLPLYAEYSFHFNGVRWIGKYVITDISKTGLGLMGYDGVTDPAVDNLLEIVSNEL